MWSRSSVGIRRASTGAWSARIPISPTLVRVETCRTSPSKTSPSGVRTCAWSVCSSATLRLGPLPLLLGLLLLALLVRRLARLLGLHALGLLEHLLDRALHVEGALGD